MDFSGCAALGPGRTSHLWLGPAVPGQSDRNFGRKAGWKLY